MTTMAKWVFCSLVLIMFSAANLAADDMHLLDAAKHQDWEAVKSLLNEGVDVNVAQPDGATSLAWAAHWDNIATVEMLLHAGADPNMANDYGVTPLVLAIQNRSEVTVNALLAGEADPNAAIWSGVTPLMFAARTGNINLVHSLLESGANPSTQEPRRDQSALMWAISFGYPEIAGLLMDHGADISAATKMLDDGDYTPMTLEGYGGNVSGTEGGGYTPLMFAARVGDMATAERLVDEGADVNAVSNDDGSALVIAAARGHEDLALYLLQQGADANQADANGMTALHYAVRDGLKALHGYDIDFSRKVCGYAADNLCKAYDSLNEEELAKLDDPLLGLYIVEPKPETPSSPLYGRNMHNLINALLAADADPNAEMKFSTPRLRMSRLPYFNLAGATPLLLASASLDEDVMSKLLEAEANPFVETTIEQEVVYRQTQKNADDNYFLGNATPLMVAAGAGRKGSFTPGEEERALEIVQSLLKLGADINESTITGWTALHAAAFIGADSLVTFLVQNGARIDVQNGCGQTPFSLAMGTTTVGLINRTAPNVDTAKLLLDLGAGNTPLSGPVGECILGRGGLELDTFQNERVAQAINSLQAEYDKRQSNQ